MKLIDLSIFEFLKAVDAPTPAPGGGSVSALAIAQGISLLRMVAHLSIGKKRFKELSEDIKQVYLASFADLEQLKAKAVWLIDEDTNAFNVIMECLKLPKNTVEEQELRTKALNEATIKATEVPYETMKVALSAIKFAIPMLPYANKTAISDFGVGLLMIKAGFEGALLNVKTNMNGFSDETIKNKYLSTLSDLQADFDNLYNQGFSEVNRILS